MALIPEEMKLDPNLIPNPVFAPDSEEKREYYFKLADLAGEKVIWSCKVLALLTVVSFVSLMWTSESTIYHCFRKEKPDFIKIDINICKDANNGKLNVTRTIGLNLIYDTYFALALMCLSLTIMFAISVRKIVMDAIRLLPYGVKLTYYGAYGTFYFCLGMITGFLFWGTLVQYPHPLFDPGEQKLYFWGFPNYPQTFWGHTTRLAADLGVLAGIIKIVLTSIKDPLDLFCSLSDMIKVSSNLQFELPVRLPAIKFTTLLSLYGKVNTDPDNTCADDFKIQQILTTLERQGLLLPNDPQTRELGIVEIMKEWTGLRSYGYEKEIQALISKGQLSSEERKQLREALKKLILNVHTKKWPLILLFSMAFSLRIIPSGLSDLFDWDDIYSNLFWFLYFFSTIGMLLFVEHSKVLPLCNLSFFGACGQVGLGIKLMVEVITAQGYPWKNYYALTPYLEIAMTVIHVIAIWKVWRIITVIQDGKKELSKEDSEKPELAAPLVSEIII